MGTVTAYNCGARDYLQRASCMLAKGDRASLFYAAFEIRCGVEARMEEYLEVAESLSQKKKQGWRIAELGKNLEKAFRLGDKIVELTFEDPSTGKKCSIYHTPVTSLLRKQGQQLGNYLHSMKTYHGQDDPWWQSFKLLLQDALYGLLTATCGTLKGPPLLIPDGKHITTNHEIGINLEADEFMRIVGRVGAIGRMKVTYLDKLPFKPEFSKI